TYSAVATITDPNYSGTDSESFGITKATVSVTADNKSMNSGDVDPAFTFSYGAFQGTDDSSVIDTAPTCSVAGTHSAPGTYDISCAGGSDNNYDFSYATGTLTVVDATPPVLTIPSDMSVQATSSFGANVNFSATANDDVDGAVTPVCTPASGSVFA